MVQFIGESVVQCSNFDQLSTVVNSTFGKSVFILFSGDIDNVSGLCWCPDCNQCYPIIKEALKTISNDNIKLIVCFVGDKTRWRSLDNDFRKDSPFMIEKIPTLLNLKNGSKLVEKDLFNLNNVLEFFSR